MHSRHFQVTFRTCCQHSQINESALHGTEYDLKSQTGYYPEGKSGILARQAWPMAQPTRKIRTQKNNCILSYVDP